MLMTRKLLGATALATLFAGAALADPALIYDMGGKFDKSFNEAAFNGAERWAAETGGTYRDIEMQSEAQREQALRRMAEGGANPVVMTGFSFMSILNEVAPDFPDTTFVIIDGVVNQPNVRSVVFTEHEGSYLVGMAAAMASQSGTVSFVGGMDIPLIRRFACGYVQGVMAHNPNATVLVSYTGTTPAAWNDPVRGGEITEAQIGQGSDVVFAAAGGTGVGVLQTAADRGILSIGVDSNQNYLHPGQVLTSMLKRVDNAVFAAMSEGPGMETGIHVMNLASGGVGWALDEHNDALITGAMRDALAEAEARIVAGDIVVHDYMSNDSCPFPVN
jgi:basic membrane protein A and related proteins